MSAQQILDELTAKWQQRFPGLAKLQFCGWLLWKERDKIYCIDKLGVYILGKYDGEGSVPSAVDFLDENIIYIGMTNVGKTTSFGQRLEQFHRTAFQNKDGHAGGFTYRRYYAADQEGLYVSVCPVYWTDEHGKLLVQIDEKEELEEFIIDHVITWLEVCLRGLYVFKWSRLPKCNKE
jgi:hypothetical protein